MAGSISKTIAVLDLYTKAIELELIGGALYN